MSLMFSLELRHTSDAFLFLKPSSLLKPTVSVNIASISNSSHNCFKYIKYTMRKKSILFSNDAYIYCSIEFLKCFMIFTSFSNKTDVYFI